MKFEIKTKGIDEIATAFRELKDRDAVSALKYGARQASIFLRDVLRKTVPIGPLAHLRRTGKFKKRKHYKLSRAITYYNLSGKRGVNNKEIIYAVGQGKAIHGRFLEYGTKKMSKRPWLEPTAKAATPQIYEILKKAVELYISRKKFKKR
jgi:HK97 gp10 family phage protein